MAIRITYLNHVLHAENLKKRYNRPLAFQFAQRRDWLPVYVFFWFTQISHHDIVFNVH